MPAKPAAVLPRAASLPASMAPSATLPACARAASPSSAPPAVAATDAASAERRRLAQRLLAYATRFSRLAAKIDPDLYPGAVDELDVRTASSWLEALELAWPRTRSRPQLRSQLVAIVDALIESGASAPEVEHVLAASLGRDPRGPRILGAVRASRLVERWAGRSSERWEAVAEMCALGELGRAAPYSAQQELSRMRTQHRDAYEAIRNMAIDTLERFRAASQAVPLP